MPTFGSAFLVRGVIASPDGKARGARVNQRELTRVRLGPLPQIGGALATSMASGLPQAEARLIHQRNSISQLGCNSVTVLACWILAAGEGCGILTPRSSAYASLFEIEEWRSITMWLDGLSDENSVDNRSEQRIGVSAGSDILRARISGLRRGQNHQRL